MVNTQNIESAIRDSGKKKGYLAERLGISRNSFYKKLNGISDFKGDEILILLDELGIDNVDSGKEIFFA